MGLFDHYWFGLVPPAGVTVAWGARAIDDGRTFGVVHDRQSMKGSAEETASLAKRLNGGVLQECQAEFARLKNDWKINANKSQRVTLYDKNGITVEGNTNASYGYFYVCAYPSLTEGQILGLDADGCIIQWNAVDKVSYNCGETPEEFGLAHISAAERTVLKAAGWVEVAEAEEGGAK